MDHRSFRYFVVLYETRSFLKAADNIPMTVQGLRKSIRLLEDELKTPLYYRGKEQLSFTKAGELFFQFCVNELEQYRDLLETIDKLRQGRRAELNLAFSTGSFGLFTPQFPKRMHADYDGERVSYVSRPENEIVKGLKAGHYDYGIMWAHPDPEHFSFEKVIEVPLSIIVNKENELSKETHIPITRLRSEKIIFYDSKLQPFQSVEKAFLLNGVEPNFSYITNETEVMLSLLMANMGVSFVFPNAIAMYDKSLFHIVLVDNVTTQLWICNLKQHRIKAEERRVIDLLKQIAKENTYTGSF